MFSRILKPTLTALIVAAFATGCNGSAPPAPQVITKTIYVTPTPTLIPTPVPILTTAWMGTMTADNNVLQAALTSENDPCGTGKLLDCATAALNVRGDCRLWLADLDIFPTPSGYEDRVTALRQALGGLITAATQQIAGWNNNDPAAFNAGNDALLQATTMLNNSVTAIKGA